MKIQKFTLLLLFVFCWFSGYSQNNGVSEVSAKGIGVARADALQDALRNAIGQATGVALSSTTQVENFAVISDAIATNQKGYISSYKVTSEGKEGDTYAVNVKALVSMSALKADAQLLYKSIGGVRFLVTYNPEGKTKDELNYYEFAVNRINTYLGKRNYRYVEPNRAKELQREAMNMAEDGSTTPLTFVQQLGLLSNAQFIIFLNNVAVDKKSEAFETRTLSKLTLDLSTYDNCTAEGLGMKHFESDYVNDEGAKTRFELITGQLDENMDDVLNTFNTYVGNWVNNGTPYELRFYQSGTYRDLRTLRDKMKADASFGGDLEIVSAENYTKVNCTFRKKPDELADKLLDLADAIPALKPKNMDVKLIYGRQISFAPQTAKVAELQQAQKLNPDLSADAGSEEAAPAPPKTISKTPAKAPAKKPAAKVVTKKIVKK
ncbi:hypothetical protein [Adhaeribacter soli]|uniref:DUF541 domain-containing protein n=1 Tax=Adhaeribacter soli TaxID=2607655 RepID=A0A5N1J1Q1_9BACT|nr:hypothetical protein [Adhaeribacter soli]KAA9340668.1 hypothetical protein F0P94_04365 [Adhaeribacter soli]